MNTKHKGTHVRECDECGWNFMTVGEIPIRLSQYRKADIDGKTDKPMRGKCPLHQHGHVA